MRLKLYADAFIVYQILDTNDIRLEINFCTILFRGRVFFIHTSWLSCVCKQTQV